MVLRRLDAVNQRSFSAVNRLVVPVLFERFDQLVLLVTAHHERVMLGGGSVV